MTTPTLFTNLSQNATQFEWDFGDGTSSEKDPTHVYTGPTGDYTVFLMAQNICNSDSTNQPLTVEDYAITISPETASQSADPGNSVVYSLQMTNTGTLADTFEVTASGNSWTTQLSETNLELDPTEAVTVDVGVMIPTDAGGNEEDTVVITVQALSDPRSSPFQATAELTTISNYVSPWNWSLPPPRKAEHLPKWSTMS